MDRRKGWVYKQTQYTGYKSPGSDKIDLLNIFKG
jgi:hypothetical protein